MLFRVAAFALLSASRVNSSNVRYESRQLSLETKFAGYEPNSKVTDHGAIDLDQAAIETELEKGKDAGGFAIAQAIYEKGGNSKSYASIKLSSGIPKALEKGAKIVGKNTASGAVTGTAKSAAAAGATEIDVVYDTVDSYPHVMCKVGALKIPVTGGCLAATGKVSIDGTEIGYSYDIKTANKNGRTMQGFSTAAKAKMFDCGVGCPHKEYMKFYTYYGQHDYADKWIIAAMGGTKTNFTNGNADFSPLGDVGKTEVIKKGTAYMSVYMYVIREFEDAITDCQVGCMECNEDPVHAWDEGVAFYAGSMTSEANEIGELMYSLADKRCENFKTCGEKGDAISGTSMVNIKLIKLFTKGKNSLLSGKCTEVRPILDEITSLMSVPLVQGTLRYAYKVGKQAGAEKENSEGAAFAASVLPIVHACSPADAKIIYDNMMVSTTPKRDFATVKKAFENNYGCMGITCEMVGTLMEGDKPYADVEVCSSDGPSRSVVMALSTALGAFAVAMLA